MILLPKHVDNIPYIRKLSCQCN